MNETINNSITKSQGVSVSDGKAVTRDWGRLVGSVLGIAGGAALAYFTGGSSLALAPFLAKALPLSASAAFMGGNLVSAPSGQHNKSKNKTTNENTSDTNGVATSNGTSYGKTITDTKQVGTSDSYTIEDAHVKNVLSKIDRYFKRLDSCEAQGGFQFASYVMTNTSANLSKRIATLFKGLIKGSDSDLDAQVVSTWNDNESARMVINSIASFEHPKFTVDGSNAYFTPALLVTSKELAVGMSLPKKTIPGVTVCESASFGRNIPNQKGLRTITIGNVYHLGSKEAAPLTLDIDKFTEHVFVTGSTGTGKSFMTQSLINGLINEDVNFLVIEPAKGEYKEAYCKYAKIYGTNPEFQLFGEDKTPVEMLKVNPFSFPATTGLFGHVDKLLDVFASVWQLEYAMRPLLKQSILRAYQLKGWDTTNGYSASREFPNFRDVKSCVEPVVKKVFPNDGDTRLRNEYIGSIVGNIEEMTCGLEEQIFFGDEVESEKLFESNVVIDLSKVGDRTKSLLMNFITIKLNEYRSSKGTPTNSRLKHVTILEEAHNIFPRNATSKAVMDSNANLSRSIAELRSFGEGFIIIDQSPSAVDQSVIRNTNTKIILKLPDREDREAVGASIGLNQEQITEMAKLNTGVAVFYQSGWSESVLGISKKNDIVRSFENPNKNNGTKGPNVSNKLIENILCSDYPGGVSITDSDLGRILSHLANKDEIELMRSILNGNVLSEEQNLLRQYMILKYSKENQPTVKETK